MDLSTLIVIIVGSFMYFGFAVWGAFYSRQSDRTTEHNKAEELNE